MNPMICQKAIAKELGISQSSVSLALRKKPGVSSQTAAKVRAAAERMGYIPDPMLTSLASYRERRRIAGFKAVLPFLHHDENLEAHHPDYPWGRIYNGIKSRASYLGYKIEPMLVPKSGVDPKHFFRVLESRGINGVICGPSIKDSGWLTERPSNSFIKVSVGLYPKGRVSMIHVAADHYQNARLLVEKIPPDFRHVLAILTIDQEINYLDQYSACLEFLAKRHTKRQEIKVIHLNIPEKRQELASMILSRKYDLLILKGVYEYDLLRKNLTGEALSTFLEVPVSLLCWDVRCTHPGGVTGVDEKLEAIGSMAISALTNALATRGDTEGDLLTRSLVAGEWVSGGVEG